jgi:large subunit ribosomal protein L9
MQVILLSDVDKVGLRGEVVDVARGYARNFLLPRRLAEEATPGRVAQLRRRDELRSRQEARNAEQAADIAEVLRKTVLSFDVKAGPTGSLFGSVTPTDIADEIWRTRKIRVDRRKIGLDEPLKRIGRYEVPITVFEGVEVEVKTLVVPEGGELPPEEELEAMAAAEEAAAQEAESEEGEVDVLEVAVEELDAAEAAEAEAAAAAAEPTAGEPPATEGDTAVEEVAAAGAAPEVPEDAFDRAVDEAVGAGEDERPSA